MEKVSYTFTVGSNPNSGNNCLRLWFRNAGSRNSVTGFQLEPGPVATPFEHRPIGTELALCQRYYQTVSGITPPVYSNQSGNFQRAFDVLLPVRMRVAPSFTADSNEGNYALGSTPDQINGNSGSVPDDRNYPVVGIKLDAEL